MASTFADSLELVKENFRILKQDKELILFPVISGIMSMLLIGFILGIFVFFIAVNPFNAENNAAVYMPFMVLGGVLSWILISFIAGFFNAGLISCVHIRLHGGDPTFRDGFKIAVQNIKKIFYWSLIAGTVGYILNSVSRRSGILGRMIGVVGSLAWGLLTFFVIPVIIFEDLGIIESIKRSGELFKKTWGENVIGQTSMMLFFVSGFLIFVLFPVVIFAFMEHGIPRGSIIRYGWFSYEILMFVFMLIVIKSLQGIYVTVLYHYATTGEIPCEYNPEFIKDAFNPGYN